MAYGFYQAKGKVIHKDSSLKDFNWAQLSPKAPSRASNPAPCNRNCIYRQHWGNQATCIELYSKSSSYLRPHPFYGRLEFVPPKLATNWATGSTKAEISCYLGRHPQLTSSWEVQVKKANMNCRSKSPIVKMKIICFFMGVVEGDL